MNDLLPVLLDQDAEARIVALSNAYHNLRVRRLRPVDPGRMDLCTLLGALEPVLRNGYGTHILCNPILLTWLRGFRRVFARPSRGLGRLLLGGWRNHKMNGL